MDLRQLSYFIAVAEEGQFTRGSTRLSVAQPAVSSQIGRLENELGEALFHRGRRGVTLTEAGEALLPHARAALSAAQRGRDAIASLRGMLHGRLRIGVSKPLDRRFTEAVGSFHREYPAIEIVLSEQHNEPLLRAVENGEIDAAIVGMPQDFDSAQIRARVISIEPLVVAVRPGDPLSRRRTIRLTDLREKPMITLTRGSRASSSRSSSSPPKVWAWPSCRGRRSGRPRSACWRSPPRASRDARRWSGTSTPARRQDGRSSRLPASTCLRPTDG
jgi:DNA-binding transcriptional LysR family regulator